MFDDLKTYYVEWRYADGRCCNGHPCARPGTCSGRGLNKSLLAKLTATAKEVLIEATKQWGCCKQSPCTGSPCPVTALARAFGGKKLTVLPDEVVTSI